MSVFGNDLTQAFATPPQAALSQPPAMDPSVLDQQGQEDAAMELLSRQLDDQASQYNADANEARRQHELVAELRTEYYWAKTERERYNDDLWNEIYRLYRIQLPDERKSGEWRSKINVPNAWNAVESAVPHMMEGLFASDDTFSLRCPADDNVVQAHENLIKWELTEKIEIESEWEMHQRQKCMYGTSAVYTGFRTDYEDRSFWSVSPNPDSTQPPQYQIVKENVPVYVAATVTTLDIYNIYPHPRATPKNIPWLFLVQYMTREQMIQAKRFKDLDKMSETAVVSAPNQDTLVGERRDKEGSVNAATSLVAERVYPIITKYDNMKKMVYSFNLYTDVLLEEASFPFFHNRMPIVFDRVTMMPHEFWGVGFVEPILSLIHEQNSIRNMRRDNENLTCNAMMEVAETQIIDEEDELVFRPGGVIHSNTGQAVKFLQPPELPDSLQAETKVEADIDKTTGLSGPVVGEAAKGVNSASGNSLLQKAQLLRLRRGLKNEAACYKEVLSQILANNCQFLPLPEVMNVLGPLHFGEYQNLDLKTLASRSVISVQPAGIYDDEDVKRQQMTNLTNVLGANQNLSQKIDWDVFLKQLLRLNGFSDPSLVLLKPKGIDLMQSMLAAEENMHMAMGMDIAPATPEDDYDVHTSLHWQAARLKPDQWQYFGTHLYSHDMVKEQGIMAQAQQQAALAMGGGQPAALLPPGGNPQGGQQGPGSMPPGGQGGLNVARQPAAKNGLGVQRQMARLTPTGGR